MTTQLQPPRIVRSRISEKLSFPIGYELARDQLAAKIPLSETRFSFSPHPTTFASDFSRILRQQEPYCVLRVERRAAMQSPVPEAAHWHFTVYPVPRELKSVARSALSRDAFSKLRDFISRAPTHWNYHNRVDAIFDPTEKTCRMEQLWEL